MTDERGTPSAHSIQHPTRYFHGTKATLERGDVLLPRREHGAAPTTAPMVQGVQRLPESDDWVYVTTDRVLAWAYAHKSGGNGDPVVLVVEPQGVIEPDHEHSGPMPVYRCESARVVVVDPRHAMTSETAAKGWDEVLDPRTVPVKNVTRPQQ